MSGTVTVPSVLEVMYTTYKLNPHQEAIYRKCNFNIFFFSLSTVIKINKNFITFADLMSQNETSTVSMRGINTVKLTKCVTLQRIVAEVTLLQSLCKSWKRNGPGCQSELKNGSRQTAGKKSRATSGSNFFPTLNIWIALLNQSFIYCSNFCPQKPQSC